VRIEYFLAIATGRHHLIPEKLFMGNEYLRHDDVAEVYEQAHLHDVRPVALALRQHHLQKVTKAEQPLPLYN